MYNYSLSDFFTKSKKKKSSSNNNRDMNQKGKRGKPELLRCNAVRNIDYDATPSSSSSSSSFCLSELSTSALVTRSLDLSDKTSFRVNGVGELDVICRILGFSGPDEFEIPAEVWAARNTRFNSDLLPISRLDSTIESVVAPKEGGEHVRDLADSYVDSFRFSDRVLSMGGSVGIDNGVGAGVGGLKGDRPPVLAPPPSVIRPIVDHSCSTWDLFRSFGPDSDNGSPEGTSVLSESCSFTTSNYDDSSSTTTDLTPNISPTGRFRSRITFWQRGKLLGRGSFGSVYEAIAEDGFLLAIKEVSLTDQGSQAKQSVYQLEQEIDLLSRFEHENIVQYYGTEKDESNLYIFLELVKGSLVSLYQMYRLIDSQVSRYTIQILHGLKYLHDQNVVHRDIKCANILVGADGVVKLADFGLAKATILNDVKSCKGTAFWMAPEVVNGKKQGYGLPADIWSLGCTVLEMFTGRTPYSPMEPIAALFRIGSGEPPPLPKDLSPDARNFILQCIQKKPSARPSASQLLDHPFVKRWAHFMRPCLMPISMCYFLKITASLSFTRWELQSQMYITNKVQRLHNHYISNHQFLCRVYNLCNVKPILPLGLDYYWFLPME